MSVRVCMGKIEFVSCAREHAMNSRRVHNRVIACACVKYESVREYDQMCEMREGTRDEF